METNIDCMKYRTSTHLASVDIEAIIAEKGICELTIKLPYYDTNIDVNGRKMDGYFIAFEEPVKEWKVNSGNRKKISAIVKELKNCTPVESRNISNWVGLKIGLMVDPTIKLKGEVVGGIVVDLGYKQKPKKTLEEAKVAFSKVNSRPSFEEAMRVYKDFLQNPDIVKTCKSLAETYKKA